MRFDSQFSRMTSQRFSTGLSSGDFGGSGRMVIFVGTTPGVLSGKQPLVASIVGYITLGARMRQLTTSTKTARRGRPRPVQSRGWRRLPES